MRLCISKLHPEARVDYDGEKCSLCENINTRLRCPIQYDPHGASRGDIHLLEKQPSLNENLSSQLQASIEQVRSKNGWSREDLFRETQAHFNACLELMKKRNVEYAPESDPFANFRDLRLLALVQEMNNVLCRLKRWADADYRGLPKPMTEKQIEDAERDMANFSALFHSLRLELEGK